MNKVQKKMALKAVIILAMISIVTACMLTRSFAALSANYQWNSDTAQTGSFNYTDTTYNFSLFGNSELYPGDSGSGILNGPDFGALAVTWSFNEENPASVPIIYYVSGETKPTGIYSAYPYMEKTIGKYVKISETEYIAAEQISQDKSVLAAALNVGCEVKWLWPETLYEKSGDEYISDESSEIATAYLENNAALCKRGYAYDPELMDLLLNGDESGNGKLLFLVKEMVGDSYRVLSLDGIRFEDGRLKSTEGNVPYFKFSEISIEDAVSGEEHYIGFINNKQLDAFSKATDKFAKHLDIGGDFAVNNDLIVPSPGNANRIMVKIRPSELSAEAKISVTFSATVSQI